MEVEFLFEEPSVRSVGDQLDRLVEQGHTRLLLNLDGVRYLSCALIGRIAAIQEKLDPVRGRIRLCGLDPLLGDVLRITHLDRVFDSYGDESPRTQRPVGTEARLTRLSDLSVFFRDTTAWGWPDAPQRPLLGAHGRPERPERIPRYIPCDRFEVDEEEIRKLERGLGDV
jgi:anti-anti-sigma factor